MTDFRNKTPEELKEMRGLIDKAIADAENERRNEALTAARKAASDLGYTLEDLMGQTAGKMKARSQVKYRHPQDPSKTWVGRGRRPKWLEDELSKGHDLQSFAV